MNPRKNAHWWKNKPLRIISIFLFSLFLFPACLITASPETRGWRCERDSECTPRLRCVEGFCRALCDTDLDCQEAYNEVCLEKKLPDIVLQICTQPCQAGEERECFTGDAQKRGVGICKTGRQRCSSFLVWEPCLGETLPQQERCNGQDDDCDGQIDNGITCECLPGETRNCYTGPEGTRNQGLCKEGVEACTGEGRWSGQCNGQLTPKSELCNGKDDDCDGQIDNNPTDIGKPCDVPGILGGPCKTGTSECRENRLRCRQVTQPKVEECNGIDDDCDGKIDNNPLGEDFTLTRPCYTGTTGCSFETTTGLYNCTGICRSGAQRCSQTLKDWEIGCLNEVKPLGSEECNGRDDNCNGMIDENASCPSGRSCVNGVCQ